MGAPKPQKIEKAMLTTVTRLKLQEICGRIARGESVSLQERVLLQKFAKFYSDKSLR